MTRIEQRVVIAPDRTPITVDVVGSGPPLVVVHGSLCQAADWHAVALALANDFTVFVMNRRGHGPTPDGPEYSCDREVDDVAAVMEAAGPGASLLGHSFGGALSLAYATKAASGGSLELPEAPVTLIAYEPGVRAGEPGAGAEAVDVAALVEEALKTRGPQDALLTGMRLFAGFPADAISGARQPPAWQQQVDMVPTWPREMRVLGELAASSERFARIRSSTLLLSGAESPRWLRETTARMARTIPRARLVSLPAQGHNINETAPQALAGIVRELLRGPDAE